MLRIIPVLDVRGGLAVHAVAGCRDDYRPLRSNLRPGSDPVLIAAAVRDQFGFQDLYLADLDAIAGSPPMLNLYKGLADLGLKVSVDAGLVDAKGLDKILETGVTRVVVGLETVAGPRGLTSVLGVAGPARVIFSLDLREGQPIVAPDSDWNAEGSAAIAGSAVALGVETVILLDLSRVGTGHGIGTLPLLKQLSDTYPGVEWIAGGGIAQKDDLVAIERAGGSAVLVGSVLHDGRFRNDWLN